MQTHMDNGTEEHLPVDAHFFTGYRCCGLKNAIVDDSNLIIDQQSIWPILWSRFIGVYATYHYTDTKIANTKKKRTKKTEM